MAVAMAREGLGLAFTYRSCAEANENVRYLRIGRNGVFLDLGIAYLPANTIPTAQKHWNRLYGKYTDCTDGAALLSDFPIAVHDFCYLFLTEAGYIVESGKARSYHTLKQEEF